MPVLEIKLINVLYAKLDFILISTFKHVLNVLLIVCSAKIKMFARFAKKEPFLFNNKARKTL